ncbi:hypothetical protein [Oerskovia jenensis]|uniref:hypothetical protein n=1 Tax=Oerskovia jenensis TaxID=162169 RepID=UPI0036D8DAE0
MRTTRMRALAVSALVAATVVLAPSASAAPVDAGPCTFDLTRTGNTFRLDAGTCDWVHLEITANAWGINLSRSASTTDVTTFTIEGPAWSVTKGLAVGRLGGVTGPVVRVL